MYLNKRVPLVSEKSKFACEIALNLLQPKSLRERHDQLALEMGNRGMSHKSPLPEYDLTYLPKEHRLYTINAEDSLIELSRRCSKALWKGLRSQ